MRLKRYINENLSPFDREGFNNAIEKLHSEIIPLLKKDCAPFIRELKGANSYLFSGIDKKIDSIISRELTRDIRNPIGDLDDKTRDKINLELKEKFGFDRSTNVKFGTGDYATASNYGYGYMIFPIGNFQYIWSPKIQNLNVWFRTHDKDDKTIQKAVNSYKNKNLKKAIKSKNEIAIFCKSYYIIDPLLRGRNGDLAKEFL